MDLTLNEIKNELQISAELYESKRKALNTLDKIERLENTEKKIVALKAKTNVINTFNEFKYNSPKTFPENYSVYCSDISYGERPKSVSPSKDMTMPIIVRFLAYAGIIVGLVGIAFPILLIVAAVMEIAFFILRLKFPFRKLKDFYRWNLDHSSYSDSLNRYYNKSRKELHDFLSKSEESVLAKIKEFEKKIDEEYKALENEKSKISDKHKSEREELEAIMQELTDEQNKITVIAPDLRHLSGAILRNLNLGRADNLKEAINIALEDERIAEEESRRDFEAREREKREMAYEYEMQKMQREHNREMERQAQEQTRQAQEQSRKQAEAERQARSASIQKCARCLNRGKCSISVQRNSLTCSAYKPR